MICIAHRGASGHAPENTLLAVNTALAMGALWIELDVFAVDNELVVIHDSRLERTTNGTGNVTHRDLGYLRSLDAGKGEKIPFLREALETVAGKAGINIELKGTGSAHLAGSLVLSYTNRGLFRPDQFIISSFNHQELPAIRRLSPDIRIGANIYGPPLHGARFAEALGAFSIHIHKDFVSQSFVKDAHQRGFKVFVYTINHPEDLDRMISMDVDGIFTNYPELYIER